MHPFETQRKCGWCLDVRCNRTTTTYCLCVDLWLVLHFHAFFLRCGLHLVEPSVRYLSNHRLRPDRRWFHPDSHARKVHCDTLYREIMWERIQNHYAIVYKESLTPHGVTCVPVFCCLLANSLFGLRRTGSLAACCDLSSRVIYRYNRLLNFICFLAAVCFEDSTFVLRPRFLARELCSVKNTLFC